MNLCRTEIEQNGSMAVIEGQTQAVNQFVRNCGPGVKRGATKLITSTDRIVTNQANLVKVTSYEPVAQVTPLGIPSLNLDPSEQVQHVSGGGTLRSVVDPDESAYVEPKKPPIFFGAQGATNKGPLGLPVMSFAEGLSSESQGKPASGTGVTDNSRPQRTTRRKPLGLPKLFD